MNFSVFYPVVSPSKCILRVIEKPGPYGYFVDTEIFSIRAANYRSKIKQA